MAVTELTDAQYEIADAIERWLEARPGRDFNTSQIARGVKASHPDTRKVLRWMAINRYVNHNGRYLTSLGRYSTRRA
jgi:hypothetical protein